LNLSRQSIALVLTIKNKETQHYIHQKHKRETEKTALANKTIYTLIWYAFYDLCPGNGVSPILTAPEPTWDFLEVIKGIPNHGLVFVFARADYLCLFLTSWMYVVLFSFVVVSTSPTDCLERLISKMTCCVSSRTLNPTHFLIHSGS